MAIPPSLALQTPRHAELRVVVQGHGLPEGILCVAAVRELVGVEVRFARDGLVREAHMRQSLVGPLEEFLRQGCVARRVVSEAIAQIQQEVKRGHRLRAHPSRGPVHTTDDHFVLCTRATLEETRHQGPALRILSVTRLATRQGLILQDVDEDVGAHSREVVERPREERVAQVDTGGLRIGVPEVHQSLVRVHVTQEVEVRCTQVETLQIGESCAPLWRYHDVSSQLRLGCAHGPCLGHQVLRQRFCCRKFPQVRLQVVHESEMRVQGRQLQVTLDLTEPLPSCVGSLAIQDLVRGE